jgi:DNA mismatch endonuclease, patch repair protein
VQVAGTRVRPDVVFTLARVAVFVDGCFFHSCPQHGRPPNSNTVYWGPKLRRNVERDRAADAALAEGGWAVVRVWEHDDPAAAAQLVVAVVRTRTRAGRRSAQPTIGESKVVREGPDDQGRERT